MGMTKWSLVILFLLITVNSNAYGNTLLTANWPNCGSAPVSGSFIPEATDGKNLAVVGRVPYTLMADGTVPGAVAPGVWTVQMSDLVQLTVTLPNGRSSVFVLDQAVFSDSVNAIPGVLNETQGLHSFQRIVPTRIDFGSYSGQSVQYELKLECSTQSIGIPSNYALMVFMSGSTRAKILP